MKPQYSYTWEPKALAIVILVAIICFMFSSCSAPKQYNVYAYEVQKDTTGKRDVYTLKPLWVKSTTQTLQDKSIIVQVQSIKP